MLCPQYRVSSLFSPISLSLPPPFPFESLNSIKYNLYVPSSIQSFIFIYSGPYVFAYVLQQCLFCTVPFLPHPHPHLFFVCLFGFGLGFVC